MIKNSKQTKRKSKNSYNTYRMISKDVLSYPGRNKPEWSLRWASLSEIGQGELLKIREVVHGPFLHPKLLQTLPTVVTESPEKSEITNSSCCKYQSLNRRGIPDPWNECMILQGFCNEKDCVLLQRNCVPHCWRLTITNELWNKLGLPFVQGIPDPWKMCNGINTANHCRIKLKKKFQDESTPISLSSKTVQVPNEKTSTVTLQKSTNKCSKSCKCPDDRKCKKKNELESPKIPPVTKVSSKITETSVGKFRSCFCDWREKNLLLQKIGWWRKKVKRRINKRSESFYAKAKSVPRVSNLRQGEPESVVKHMEKYPESSRQVTVDVLPNLQSQINIA
ncbi:uncharacterized protein [Prorops nasuta]|uniref:uncharacterized protein isoform X2 n=1 Tax=Prorops nasuta TaxID=863751 RepID=UPI0034CE8C5E